MPFRAYSMAPTSRVRFGCSGLTARWTVLRSTSRSCKCRQSSSTAQVAPAQLRHVARASTTCASVGGSLPCSSQCMRCVWPCIATAVNNGKRPIPSTRNWTTHSLPRTSLHCRVIPWTDAQPSAALEEAARIKSICATTATTSSTAPPAVTSALNLSLSLCSSSADARPTVHCSSSSSTRALRRGADVASSNCRRMSTCLTM
mmetsp:Transcript_25444/g.81664  ORF Transcript_25444/g.81664 Transcript_25444/m.81664 type:complete len:202 (+) Transcript_25444:96-701(+)